MRVYTTTVDAAATLGSWKTESRAASTWRTALLAGIVALTPGVAFGADEVTKLRLGILGGNPVAALLAYDKGYFEASGIEVELVPLQSGPAAIAATTSGSVHVSFGDLFAWVAGLSNGFENVKLIAPAAYPSYGSLLVRSDGGIRTAADVEGKRIGAPGAPLFSTVNKLWLANNSVNPDTVSFVIVPPGGESTALSSDSVDAIYAYNDLVALSVKAALPVVAVGIPTDEIPEGATTTGYYANAAFIDANPEAIADFADILRRGAKEYSKLPDEEKAELFTKYNNLQLSELLERYPSFFEEFHPTPVQTGPIDAAATQKWVDVGFSFGAFPNPVEIAPFIHDTALPRN